MHEYRALIQNSLNTIEAMLEGEIDAAGLAAEAGFSLYHYCRIFQSETGMPVMRYVTRRRLLRAAYLMSLGTGRTEAALRCGFDTYAGFYRAFVRELGCTPAAYLGAGRARLPAKIILEEEEHPMITREKAASLLPLWGMEGENIRDIYNEGPGTRSENSYAVGEDHIMKFTSDRRKLLLSLEIPRKLVNAGLAAPMPVPLKSFACETEDNRGLYAEKDGMYYWIYRKLPGSPLSSAEFLSESGARKAVLIGEAVGRLDLALKDAEFSAGAADLFHDSDLIPSLRDWALPAVKDELMLSHEFCLNILDDLNRLYPLLPRQVIHRDPHLGNIISLPGQSAFRAGFIDFELSERNIRLYDPLYTATSVLSENGIIGNEELEARWLDILKGVLAGYDRTAALTAAEKEAVPAVLAAHQIVFTAYFRDLSRFAGLYETNRQMTLWLIRQWREGRLASAVPSQPRKVLCRS